MSGATTPPFAAHREVHLVAPWKPHTRCFYVAPRQVIEDPIEASRNPLRILAVIAIITLIILVRGVLLRLPPHLDLARRSVSACRSRFFFLVFFLLRILCEFLLLDGSTSLLAVDIVLLYRRLHGPKVDRSLVNVKYKRKKDVEKNGTTKQQRSNIDDLK